MRLIPRSLSSRAGLAVPVLACTALFALRTPAEASHTTPGKIVVANDDWTLDTGFFPPNDPVQFVQNVTAWFTGGKPGNFLAYSNNHGLTSPLLAEAVEATGNTWTQTTDLPFTLPTLLHYNGVFVGGYGVDSQVLTDYVNAGGNVYVFGGTGDLNGADGEAGTWNPFLNQFGLAFDATQFNGVQYTIPINSDHPIFKDVDHLYQDNGNSVLDLSPSDPRNQVLVTVNGQGLYAVFAVPEPGVGAFLSGLSMAGGILLRKRRHKRCDAPR